MITRLQKQRFNLNSVTVINSVTETDKFCNFKNDYNHIKMKIITKLLRLKDYNV
ncbi:hypothetical protein EMPG_10525 [Blastomyces silverae]|uniref:Uncharacterized protein n=1 Tax=Blastomyces silverae TaxID=2060906 RepID=A0A0H1B3T8_9EURO|nr:hypothetical protein EMPG_10525 [Blastomyces silverae]